MLQLPNNCRAGKISVSPNNWQTSKADVNSVWYISYRFYDDTLKKSKKVIIKGMNNYKTLSEKRDAVKILIEDELDLIQNKGYNRISNRFLFDQNNYDTINPSTPFIEALELALKSITIESATRKDIDNVLKYIKTAIEHLQFDRLFIKDIRKKHIKILLEECKKLKSYWSESLFNNYRKYLQILFNEIAEFDAIEFNPINGIKKKKVLKKIRTVLTLDEREKINSSLKNNHYNFWRFMQIFFHSGARIKELIRLKIEDVDLVNQKFKVVIYKGNNRRETLKTIKNIALPFWKEIVADNPDSYFVFSKDLAPGENMIRADQITKRWYRLVKKKLNINADFYSLKHLNTTEMLYDLPISDVANFNSHTSTKMIENIYDVRFIDRVHNRIKNIENKFI